ncbi:poly(A)-specific ribonuclease PARN-like [Battus philenor]|uniref:poly(A)-specific ribonuclease PARN-like n=1 Tax=Battus philenor TaxID=42288 RepID=UPI0035D031C2
MEVTRKNFKECLPLISESIDKADFLVIDAEFTGLINGRDVSIFDSPQEYYSTLLNGATEFLLIQYGLCAFYWDHKENHYMNDAYNFYLFPRGRPGPEKMFLCQSSSLDFLASQGFDFNKLIREGISYMTEPTETRLRENLSERHKSYSNEKDNISIPEEHKQQIEDICKKVREFLDENKTDEMEIDRCNAFMRRLLFQELGSRFKQEAFVETKILENKSRILKVTRIKSEDEGKNRDTQKKEKEWEEFEDAVGFSKVARMISQSEKLVIGHNMLLDLIHTLNHFFQPLPASYISFKEFAHGMFPRLLDTKYMSSLPPFKDKVNSSVLQHLFVTLSEPPFSLPKAESLEGRGYRQADDKLHEAGFDAYVTGLCFLSMHQHLARMRGDHPRRLQGPDCAALKPFLNKLFLAKTAHQDSPYMNLSGADPTPSRDHVFHLTFPKEWQRNDISQLFSAFGPITVQFLDDTSALVALSRRENARSVARTFANNTRISLVPYAKYKLLNAKTPEQLTERTREPSTYLATSVNTPEPSRVRQGSVTKPVDLPDNSRSRSNSASAAAASPPRKRTSSGVFQVDEAEPPIKKQVVTRSNSSQAMKTPEVISNGRRKTDVESEVTQEKEIHIERFDSEATTKCVSAFKESDSWD